MSALAASGSANAYSSISAPPGEMIKEDQDVLNPLGSDSTVLVVGASRGIGQEFVNQLLDKKCRVIATTRQQMQESEEGPIYLTMDVADPASIQAAAAAYKAKNLPPITHIIHNAGIYGKRKAMMEVTPEDMTECFSINTIGPLLVVQSFAPFLSPSTPSFKPVICLLTSKVGSIDDNGSGGSYPYRASKTAVNQVMKSLSIDMQSVAQFALLHPGYVRTDMTGGNGLIDVDESVRGLLQAIEATGPSTPFRFVDYKKCLIPW